MSFQVLNANAWKPVTDFYVLSSTQWKQVIEAYVLDGGVWKQFWTAGTYLYSIFSVPALGGYTKRNDNTTSGSVTGIGTEVTIVTAASAGYKFDSLSANNDATINGLVVTIQASGTTSISAVYALQSYDLNMYYVGDGTGTTDPDAAGNPHVFNYTDSLTLSAIPDIGSSFTTWVLNGATAVNLTTNPLIIPMPPNNLSVSATFEFITSDIFTTVVPAGVGTLTIDPAADAPGGKWYYTTQITATAVVTNPYYAFQEIIIDATTGLPNDTSIQVASGHSISAVFTALATATITSSVSTNGGPTPLNPGTISITPAAPTSNIYVQTTDITATATPAAYYDFAYFDIDGGIYYDNPYPPTGNFAVGGGHTIIAVFTVWPTLTTAVSGTGGGTIDPSPGSVYVQPSSSISVLATPNANYSFAYFDVDGSIITSNPYVDGIGAGHTVTAAFEIWPTLTTDVSGTGGGTIDLDTNGSPIYVEPASSITINATADSGYTFAYFDVDGSPQYSNPYSDGIGGGHTVIAAFTPDPITSVTFDPATSGTYYESDAKSVTVSASDGAPVTGYQWHYWSSVSGYVPITGANLNTYSIGTGYPVGDPTGDEYYFGVTITNAAGTFPTSDPYVFEWSIFVLPDPP